jgi:hypothetical protein
MSTFYFRGKVNLYLQGKRALEVHQQTPGYNLYYLGSKRSRIRVKDFRRAVCTTAKIALQGQKDEFGMAFSQSAMVKISCKRYKISIDIHDSPSSKNIPTLWLGVVPINLC